MATGITHASDTATGAGTDTFLLEQICWAGGMYREITAALLGDANPYAPAPIDTWPDAERCIDALLALTRDPHPLYLGPTPDPQFCGHQFTVRRGADLLAETHRLAVFTLDYADPAEQGAYFDRTVRSLDPLVDLHRSVTLAAPPAPADAEAAALRADLVAPTWTARTATPPGDRRTPAAPTTWHDLDRPCGCTATIAPARGLWLITAKPTGERHSAHRLDNAKTLAEAAHAGPACAGHLIGARQQRDRHHRTIAALAAWIGRHPDGRPATDPAARAIDPASLGVTIRHDERDGTWSIEHPAAPDPDPHHSESERRAWWSSHVASRGRHRAAPHDPPR